MALLPFALLLIFYLPVPLLDGPLEGVIADRVTQQVACPGTLHKPPKIKIKGGRLLPQLLRRRLSEVELRLPDAAIAGVDHTAFAATLRDVSQPATGSAHIGRVDAAVTVGFTNMPSLPDTPRPTFRRSPDGLLAIETVPSTEMTERVETTLFAKLELRGETMKVVPRRLLLFGKMVPAANAAGQTGGIRTEKLPHLPDGLTYRSVVPKPDGLHVALDGAVTTPFSELPGAVGGFPVTYGAHDGLLAISTSISLPVVGSIPLTIFAAPRLDGETLTLVPQSVEVLGRNRSPDDPVAALVLSQIDQRDLTRGLPTLPSGVRYRAVSVDSSGITVTIDGETVKPFSELPATVDGRPTRYSAQDDLLAITSSGTGSHRPLPVVLYTKPTIVDSGLELSPQRIEMLGVTFPAQDVLAVIKMKVPKHPLRELPGNLAYRRVEVLAGGLRIVVTGNDVTVPRGALTGGSCG